MPVRLLPSFHILCPHHAILLKSARHFVNNANSIIIDALVIEFRVQIPFQIAPAVHSEAGLVFPSHLQGTERYFDWSSVTF